jgi:beta-lactamase superfamily II metal-dependent hydrolase
MRRYVIAIWLSLLAVCAFGQANGKLQLHFIDVGQGMGAILITPTGLTVLFDDGNSKDCDKPLSYLRSGTSGKSEEARITNHRLGC